MVKEDAVSIKEVYKKFGKRIALNNVSINIKRNIIFGLLGSNGAGKTTLLHILTGLLNFTSGEICVLGEIVKSKYSKNLKKKVSIVPQKISLYEDLSIYNNLYFFGKAYGLKRKVLLEKIRELAEIFQLEDLNLKVENLSGGYQRRVSLAIALISDPEVLILDEALVGIDLETKKIIIDLLLKLKKDKTIIITTHSIQEAERICDEVCFLHRGEKVLEGKTKKIIQDYSLNHGSRIMVKFKNSSSAKSVFDKLNNKTKLIDSIDSSIEEDRIIIQFNKLVFGVQDILNVIKFIKSNEEPGSIIDFDVRKPNLEDIMLELINSGKFPGDI